MPKLEEIFTTVAMVYLICLLLEVNIVIGQNI